MIPNKSLDRLFAKPAPQTSTETPSGAVPYEEVDIVMWDFNLPCGPSQYMIEANKGDFVKEEKDRFKIRCRQNEQVLTVCIYKSQLYFHSSYETRVRIRVTAEAPGSFRPTKKV